MVSANAAPDMRHGMVWYGMVWYGMVCAHLKDNAGCFHMTPAVGPIFFIHFWVHTSVLVQATLNTNELCRKRTPTTFGKYLTGAHLTTAQLGERAQYRRRQRDKAPHDDPPRQRLHLRSMEPKLGLAPGCLSISPYGEMLLQHQMLANIANAARQRRPDTAAKKTAARTKRRMQSNERSSPADPLSDTTGKHVGQHLAANYHA